MIYDVGLGKLRTRTSPDGITWSEPQEPRGFASYNGDTHNNAFWSPELGKYVGITRMKTDQRLVAHTESADFIHWTRAVEVLRARTLPDPVLGGSRDIIRRQVQQLTRLVDDLLDVSRIARGHIALRRERIDEIMDRLLEIAGQARALRDPAAIEALTVEVDALAMDVVRYARAREPDTRTMSAA